MRNAVILMIFALGSMVPFELAPAAQACATTAPQYSFYLGCSALPREPQLGVRVKQGDSEVDVCRAPDGCTWVKAGLSPCQVSPNSFGYEYYVDCSLGPAPSLAIQDGSSTMVIFCTNLAGCTIRQALPCRVSTTTLDYTYYSDCGVVPFEPSVGVKMESDSTTITPCARVLGCPLGAVAIPL